MPGAGITNFIVKCIDAPIEMAADMLIEFIYQIMEPAIAAFMILAMTLWGVKVASGGVRKPLAEGMVFGIKLAVVVYLAEGFIDWYPQLIDASEYLLDIVTKPLLEEGMACSYVPGDDVWARMDCILFSLLTMGVVSGGGIALVGGMLGMIMTQSGLEDISGMIMMAGVGVLMTIIFAGARAVVAFITAKVAIAFLVALAPFFVPLLLLQATKNYFTKWAMQILSYMLQPLFVFAFLAFAIIAIDSAIFRGDYSFSVVVFGRPVESLEDWNQLMTEKLGQITQEERPLMNMVLSPESATWEQARMICQSAGEIGNSALSDQCALVDNAAAGADPTAAQLQAADEIVELSAQAFTLTTRTETGMEPEMILQLCTIMMICYLLYSLIGIVPEVARDIVGAFTHTKVGAQPLLFEREMTTAVQNAPMSEWLGGLWK